MTLKEFTLNLNFVPLVFFIPAGAYILIGGVFLILNKLKIALICFVVGVSMILTGLYIIKTMCGGNNSNTITRDAHYKKYPRY